MATETVVDLANESLGSHQTIKPHKLDQHAEALIPSPAPPLVKEHAKLTRDLYLQGNKTKRLAYVDVFVDDFMGLVQGSWHHFRHVHHTLFHVLDNVFHSLNRQDSKQRK